MSLTFKPISDVMVLGRVRCEYALTLRNALVLVQKIIKNYGGALIGVADKVNVLDCHPLRDTWDRCMCMVLIHFPTMEQAVRWSYSDPIFKQQDFPSSNGAIQMIAVPLSFIPPKGLSTLKMTNFHVPDANCEQFQCEFANKAAKLYDKQKACHELVKTQGVRDLNYGWVCPGDHVVIHMFDTEDQLLTQYQDSEFGDLKTTMNDLTESCTIAFTIK